LREEERRAKRSLRLFVQADGMTKLVWTMDPETAATVRDLYDRTTSPKLGGVRFVDETRKTQAEQILRDDRTPEQLASDAFVQLLRLGSDTDPRFLLGSGAPVLRITATKAAIDTRRGLARIEGQQAPVSVATAERLGCGGGEKIATFDPSGMRLDIGREQRFFTRRQREALALMWGGCGAPGCDRPPSWCEAHHIEFWVRDHGKTNAVDGILLCRHHHLLFHNNGWEIRREDQNKYWAVPPAEQHSGHDDSAHQDRAHRDPGATRILLEPRGPALRDLQRERTAARSDSDPAERAAG
jgi:Domain of unknown function (DUF222)